VPWEERQQRGLFGAFFENWKQVVAQPEEFWRRMRPDGPLGDALFFGWICFGVYLLLNLPIQMVSQGLNTEQMQQLMSQLRQALDQAKELSPEIRQLILRLVESALGKGTVAFTVGTVILYPVRVIIGAALTHLCCLIFGVAKNGFTATVRVMTYAQAPYLLGWVPCVGQIVAPIYGLVLLIWGLSRAHDSSVGRAVAAILVPVLVLCCCCGAVFGVLMAGIAGAAGKMQ
jgi:hypothetical protein